MRPPITQLTNVAALYGSGGGGGTPAWVTALQAPSGDLPSIALDFQNGRYWANGALAPVNSIVTTNASWGTWDSSVIVPGLGLPDSANPAGWITLPSALQNVGITALMNVISNGSPPINDPSGQVDSQWQFYYSDDPWSNAEQYCRLNSETWLATATMDGDNTFGQNIGAGFNIENVEPLAAPISRTAFSLLYTTAPPQMSNQGAAIVGPTNPSDVTLVTGPVVALPFAGTSFFSQTGYLSLLAIYPLQPDSDLPAIAILP